MSGDYNKALGAAVFVSFVLGFCILSLEVPTKKLEVFVDIWATSKLKFFLGLVLSSTMTAMFCVVIFNLKMWNFGNGAYPLAVGVGLANLVSGPDNIKKVLDCSRGTRKAFVNGARKAAVEAAAAGTWAGAMVDRLVAAVRDFC